MDCYGSKSARIHDASEFLKLEECKSDDPIDNTCNNEDTRISEPGYNVFPKKSVNFLKRKEWRDEDHESVIGNKIIFDPRGPIIHRWNKIFMVVCIISLFVDPMFFFLPRVLDVECIDNRVSFKVALTIIRSIADVFYAIHIIIRFRTSYVAPLSHVFGRGELVVDPLKIAFRYLSRGFCLDLIAALPIPQVVIWVMIPVVDEYLATYKDIILFSVIFQYLPRLFLIFPLSYQIIKTSGVMMENAWAGAAYNLILYILASHVIGAVWYLQAIERLESCWKAACDLQRPSCQYQYVDCQRIGDSRNTWFESSNITTLCSPGNSLIQFGIFGEAVQNDVTPSPFLQKYFYSFFWGLKNLSCLGQNLVTSPYIGENVFAIIVSVLGLVFFGLLIGNVQTYLQSTTVRFEQWRVKRTDTEFWMHHRRLPSDLKQSVRNYDVFKWVANQGVDEEALLKSLPVDLSKDIKLYLTLDLVRRVPLFDEMEDWMLDAICERLQPILYTTGTLLHRELDPVKEMVLIVRGFLESFSTGGDSGFSDSARLGPGNFSGDELLTWALDPSLYAALPVSARTVRATSEVEAFTLAAEDLRAVTSQFRQIHSKQLRHKFRYYSHQWRTWAACFIQFMWRRHMRRLQSFEYVRAEGDEREEAEQYVGSFLQAGELVMSRVSTRKGELGMSRASTRRGEGGVSRVSSRRGELAMSRTIRRLEGPQDLRDKSLRKPREPDFSMVEKS